MNVDLKFHPGQLEVIQDPARFKVIAAGKRWGKTDLAVRGMLVDSMQTERAGYSLKDAACFFIAPTYELAKDTFWNRFLDAADACVDKVNIAEGKIRMKSGRDVYIKGSDNPARLRGRKLGDVYIDEYAQMKPSAWEYVIRPALSDVKGRCTFIGTPDPESRNHFYDLVLKADLEEEEGWKAWRFKTRDNPFIDPDEIESAKRDMSRQAFLVEYEASFDTFGGSLLDPSTIIEGIGPQEGDVYITVDPAGFRDVSALTKGQAEKLDETAIAVVKVHHLGWHVLDIIHGRWDIRETVVRILRATQKYRPIKLGIERTALKHAIAPLLEDQLRRFNISLNIEDLSHSSQTKTSRIVWALQARLEQGRITFEPGAYLDKLRNQAFEFPGGRHDDLLDALAFIDQLAVTRYHREAYIDTWEPLNEAVGL